MHSKQTLFVSPRMRIKRSSPMPKSPRLESLPEMTPAVSVAATGDCLLLTRARNLNSKPSRAMANRIRGKGNIEPRRLE